MNSPSSTITEKRRNFAQRLQEKRLLCAPGVYDMISAKIAHQQGFEALYMTGYGTVASYLGLPDAGLATYSQMLDRVNQFTQIVNTPMICDADTGYGGLLNVMQTVQGYESAGACMIQFEDQEFPKKCGHMPGRRVTSIEDMVKKIRVAVDTRQDKNFLIIARTDARTNHGLDEALRRAEAYAKAGADAIFIESPESEEEMAVIARSFDVPLLANMVEGGSTPILSAHDLQALGFRIAIFPALGFLATGAALDSAYQFLKAHGSTIGLDTPLYDFQKFSSLMGFDAISDFDSRYQSGD